MSGKTSAIIIGIVLTILAISVYHYSAPNGPIHLAPMLGGNEVDQVQPVKDTTSKDGDSLTRIR